MSDSSEPISSILLCSLGTSWAVVPEAFHLLGAGVGRFSAVHVLTTDGESTQSGIGEILRYFKTRFPDLSPTVTRVNGFDDLRSEVDHFLFEEVLYRWMLDVAPDPQSRYVCLAGGFKTMSAAMQKAAAVLGAVDVFHVLADPATKTAELVDQAVASGQIRYVRLGSESGWPQLRSAARSEFQLDSVIAGEGVRSVRVDDRRFRDRVREVVERSHRIAVAWEGLSDLPFMELATWTEMDLAWLKGALDPIADSEWVRALPKVELHCHLGGFATHGDDLLAVRAAASQTVSVPPLEPRDPPAGWPRPLLACGLKPYLPLGDNNGSALLKYSGCLKKQCALLYERLTQDGVFYAEIRCSPNNYANPDLGRSAWDVLREIQSTFQGCMNKAKASGRTSKRNSDPLVCHVNLIVIATRKEADTDRSHISRHLALAITAADQWRGSDECRVVGVDLAGFESNETRAELFQMDFEPVHRVGLAVTVHAGENDDAEGIWQAVFKLHARRLGHALHLDQAKDLMRVVADRRIGVEMCPYANMQIQGFDPINGQGKSAYPLLKYLRGGICVTANTDNIGISAATLSDNLLLLAELCPGITRIDLLRLQRNALESAFLSNAERMTRVAQLAIALPRP